MVFRITNVMDFSTSAPSPAKIFDSRALLSPFPSALSETCLPPRTHEAIFLVYLHSVFKKKRKTEDR